MFNYNNAERDVWKAQKHSDIKEALCLIRLAVFRLIFLPDIMPAWPTSIQENINSNLFNLNSNVQKTDRMLCEIIKFHLKHHGELANLCICKTC